MRAFLLAVVFILGCGDLKSHSGGGGGGGSATGGGFTSTGGGGASTGGGGGFPIGGGSGTGGGSFGGGGAATGGGGVATGGGSATGGGGGPQNWNFDDAGFTFTEVVPEPNSSNHGDYDRITGLTFNDIWISDSYGFLRHYDGFSWSLIYDYGISVRYSGLTQLSSGELFASTDTAILDCPSDCTDAGSFITHGYGSTYAFTGMCTNGTEVFVAGGSAADGPLVVRVAPGAFQEWHSGLPAQHVGGCAVSSKGEVLVGLADAIGVFDSDGGFHLEDAGTDILSIWWTAMAAVGDTVVAGADEKRVAVRDAQGGWTPLVDGPNGDFSGGWINAASGGTDAILVGTSSFASGPVSVVHDGQVTLMLKPGDFTFFGIWAQSDNSFWLTGHDDNGGTAAGVLYRADR